MTMGGTDGPRSFQVFYRWVLETWRRDNRDINTFNLLDDLSGNHKSKLRCKEAVMSLAMHLVKLGLMISVEKSVLNAVQVMITVGWLFRTDGSMPTKEVAPHRIIKLAKALQALRTRKEGSPRELSRVGGAIQSTEPMHRQAVLLRWRAAFAFCAVPVEELDEVKPFPTRVIDG